MSSALSPEDVLELADNANVFLEATRVSRREAIAKILAAGRLLAEHREQIPHGSWGAYCERLTESPATIRRYMRVAALGMSAHEILKAGGISYALGERSRDGGDDGENPGNPGKSITGGTPVIDLPDPEPSEEEREALELRAVIDTRDDQIEEVTGVRPPPPPPRQPSAKDRRIAVLEARVVEQERQIGDYASQQRQAEAERADGPEADRYRELAATREELRQATIAINRLTADLAEERRARIYRDRVIRQHQDTVGCQIAMDLTDPAVYDDFEAAPVAEDDPWI